MNFQPLSSDDYAALIDRPMQAILRGDMQGAELAAQEVRDYHAQLESVYGPDNFRKVAGDLK